MVSLSSLKVSSSSSSSSSSLRRFSKNFRTSKKKKQGTLQNIRLTHARNKRCSSSYPVSKALSARAFGEGAFFFKHSSFPAEEEVLLLLFKEK